MEGGEVLVGYRLLYGQKTAFIFLLFMMGLNGRQAFHATLVMKSLNTLEVNRMPDIAMCLNEACPRKADCYRYTAEPDEYQVWAMFDAAINCCFWSNGKKGTE
jgi:hypothetical protein